MTPPEPDPSFLKRLGLPAVALGAVAVLVTVYTRYGRVSAAEMVRSQVFVDQATGKPFRANVDAGFSTPCRAPSGGETGYPADFCYWTADGHVRAMPFALIRQDTLNNPGPTFCPDCGRLVPPRAAPPAAGDAPPPKAGVDYDAYIDDLRKRGLYVSPDPAN